MDDPCTIYLWSGYTDSSVTPNANADGSGSIDPGYWDWLTYLCALTGC